jgi:hypothetical protein
MNPSKTKTTKPNQTKTKTNSIEAMNNINSYFLDPVSLKDCSSIGLRQVIEAEDHIQWPLPRNGAVFPRHSQGSVEKACAHSGGVRDIRAGVAVML